MQSPRSWILVLGLTGCISELNQTAGVGALYHTRCSADMVPTEGAYRARCTPEDCAPGFTPGPVSHVVVALDPGRKVVGYAERVCLQDLSEASERFRPALLEPTGDGPAGSDEGVGSAR